MVLLTHSNALDLFRKDFEKMTSANVKPHLSRIEEKLKGIKSERETLGRLEELNEKASERDARLALALQRVGVVSVIKDLLAQDYLEADILKTLSSLGFNESSAQSLLKTAKQSREPAKEKEPSVDEKMMAQLSRINEKLSSLEKKKELEDKIMGLEKQLSKRDEKFARAVKDLTSELSKMRVDSSDRKIGEIKSMIKKLDRRDTFAAKALKTKLLSEMVGGLRQKGEEPKPFDQFFKPKKPKVGKGPMGGKEEDEKYSGS